MICSICHQDTETRYIDLYVFGSEGLQLCQPCENELSEVVLDLALKKQRKRKQEFLSRKAAHNNQN